MKTKGSLPLKNIKGKPVRTAALIMLTALLSLTIFGGTLIVTSLKTGLYSLETRLGADVMVVPYEATTKEDLSNIVLQGNTGYFYMKNSSYEKIASREGIGKISAQFFLASTSSGCCSMPVQIIGYDPQTDFTISPWIKKTYDKNLKDLDIVVGNDLNAFVGDKLSFYGVECRVAAKLDKTGTSYDTTVFTNQNTIKKLIQSSLDKKLNLFADIDPDHVVSCVLIDADDEHSPEEIVNDINLHVKRVKAIQTKDMISGISDSLSGVSDIIGILIAAVWILGIVILLLAFTMSVNERKKEFAILRVIGASRKKLSLIVMQEALITGMAGGISGTVLGLLILLPFTSLTEQMLGLPYLLPDVGQIILFAAMSVLLSLVAGAVSAAVSAFRISRIDTALILRGDN